MSVETEEKDYTKHVEDIEIKAAYDNLIMLLEQEDYEPFREEFLKLHEYEQGEFFSLLNDEDREKLYHLLSPKEVADFFDTLSISNEEMEEILTSMDARYAAQVLGAMQYDNAADIMNFLPKEVMMSFLALMKKEDREEIRILMNYEDDTAGGIMTTEFVSIDSEMTVHEAMVHLRKVAPDSETIYYLFVTDINNKLVGIISLRDLIIADEDEYIGDIMKERVISVNVADDQEQVAYMMRDYDFLAVPVLDYQEHLVGIITADDIMDVIQEEAEEDYYRLAGMSDEGSPLDDSSFTAAKKRLPWLIGLTLMGMITATMLSTFEETLEKVALLGAFIPIIGGMSGNAGTQSLAVAVRGLATGEIKRVSLLKLAIKDILTGMMTGFTCAVLLFIIITILFGQPVVGIIVSISLFVAMTFATLSGTFIPMGMSKFGIDPAVASGPFITTSNDIISLMIYFSLANALMSALV
ncbi:MULTISPECIES: magnesium transporter [Nosocomiicoccus]|uniref:magnesium transporter n=1 Tax=Nosocomiicoccus TaxID=489909 RepID=UPI0008A32460|nr:MULTISPECIES: magnesium transporter [Nosocomiicoccus]MDK6863337.1 magnesium transporter [Nosocomiicoccus ampullae]OFO52784.1 magnesium transporter [Nosocomiicoccus sp. HMSC059G07]